MKERTCSTKEKQSATLMSLISPDGPFALERLLCLSLVMASAADVVDAGIRVAASNIQVVRAQAADAHDAPDAGIWNTCFRAGSGCS